MHAPSLKLKFAVPGLVLTFLAFVPTANAWGYVKDQTTITHITLTADGTVFFYFADVLGCDAAIGAGKTTVAKAGQVVAGLTATEDAVNRILSIGTAAFLAGKSVRVAGDKPTGTSDFACPLAEIQIK